MMRDIEKAKEIIRKAGIEIPGDKEKVWKTYQLKK
jgi:hypothetical protein